MTRAEQQQHPKWQECRQSVMKYAGFRCQICGSKDHTLHVHHSYYQPGHKMWEYPKGSMICICYRCHGKIHPRRIAEKNGLIQPELGDTPVPQEQAAINFEKMKQAISGDEADKAA